VLRGPLRIIYRCHLLAIGFFSEQVVTGWLLILSGIIFIPGGVLFSGRAIWKWPVAQSQTFLFWERGFVIAALLVAVIGLTGLERMLETAGDRILAPSGIVLLLIWNAIVIYTETFFISRQEWVYAPIVTFVVLAFLGQAAFGASILRTGFFSRMGKLGNDPLEPGLVSHSAYRQTEGYLLSRASPYCPRNYWNCSACP
jgi:hypothetical protein